MFRNLRFLVPASALAMFLCEAALIAGSYILAVYLTSEAPLETLLIDQSGWQSIAAVEGLILLGMYFRELYSEMRISSRILLLQELMLVVGGAFLAEALLSYFNLSWAMPRKVLLPGSGIALASVYIWRILFSAAIRNRLDLQRVLFLGFPPAAVQLAADLEQHPEGGFVPIGYLDASRAGEKIPLAKLGSSEDLNDVIEAHHPDWIIIGEKSAISGQQMDDLIELRFGGLQIDDVGGFCERISGRVDADVVNPSELIFSDNLLPDALNVKIQSIFSTVAAVLMLPLALPAMGVIALLLRRGSSHPVLLREVRVGLGGVPFTMYSMQLRRRGPRWDLAGIDKWIARFGMNRLPQIWNILRGEMSLVGPEADRPEFAERLNRVIPFYSQRVLVRPGVIGWAEIRAEADGSSGKGALRRLEYDLYYVKNLSFLLDVFIALRWIRNMMRFRESGANRIFQTSSSRADT